VNVYLACTVRGDRSALESTRAIAATITGLGHTLLTAHLLEDDADAAESALSERDVYERDLEWLSRADVLIAEASGSSYGVGFEVGYFLANASARGRHMLLVYNDARRTSVSRLIVGNSHPHCTTCGYRDAAGLLQAVGDFLVARSRP